jgi:glycosyltransferase involved in cell wall biosynthesis
MSQDVWALSAYPLSAGYRTRLETIVGGPLSVTLVPEMRSLGIRSMLQTLRSVNAARGLAVVEDPSSRPIVPVLRFLLSLTRCRRLALVDEHGAERPFSRQAGLAESVSLVIGSITGAVAAARCWFELRSLIKAAPLRPPVRPLAAVAYLKTNLWFGVKAGGSVGHVAGIVNELAERCQVSVFAVERPPLLDPRVTLHTVAEGGAFGYPYELNYYRYQKLFNAAVLGPGVPVPDLLYQRLSLANYSGVVAARRLRRPLVLEYNGSEVWVSRHWGRPLTFPRLGALAEDVMLEHADLIVTVSDVLRDELLEKGLSPERVLSHPNCIDPKRFDPDLFTKEDRRELLGRYHIPDTAVVCGFVGTFGAWHGVTVLAEAISRLCTAELEWVRAHDVRFLIVGDGLLMPKVRDILTGVPPDRAVLTGLVPQHEAPRYLAASDILLSPHVPNADGSRFFGSPTKLFEYMAMSRGIVASDLDQIGEVLRHSYRAADLPAGPCPPDDDHVAVLTTPGSVDELVAGVRFLVEREDYRVALGRAARTEVLRRYTWKRNVDELLARLRELNAADSPGADA